MNFADFIARCDAYCEAAGVSRRWLSKRLFQDTFRLEHLAETESDVGVKRMERAVVELEALERALSRGAQEGERPAA